MDGVLITGGRAPVAVDLARHFARGGWRVIVADSAPCFLARGSAAVFRAVRVPPPRQQPRAFARAIRDLVKSERVRMIVPTCEEVFYLGRFADELRPVAELFCVDFPLLAALHSKWQFTLLARGLGIEIPETRLLEAKPEPGDFDGRPADWVFKPVFSRFAVHTLVQPDDVAVRALAPTPSRPWVAQRFVAGRELCSYAVARAGRVTAHALYEPQWRAGRGSGYYFQPTVRPAIEAFTARMVANTNYTGQIAFDFIEAANGRIHVIECNPRATSGLHLFGGNARLADAFVGEPPETLQPTTSRPAMLGAAMLFIGSLDAVRRGQGGRWWRDWRRARDVLWAERDAWPAFYLFAGLSGVLLGAARRGITPQAASTGDIEWDGEEIASS